MKRIAITGGPRTGKTTLANTLAEPAGVRHTDDTMHLPWSDASKAAAEYFDDFDALVIEGVAVPRALRKWLTSHPKGKPVDIIVVLNFPFEDLTKGQISMTKGCATVFTEIYPELLRRGVTVGNRTLLD